MNDSIIINFIITLFKKILEIYDNSFLEKIIASVCGFFKKSASGSVICNAFTNKFLCGSFWRESAVFKVITSPIRLLFALSKKLSAGIKERDENSAVMDLINNIFRIPVRQYGILCTFFTVGSVIGMLAVRNFTAMRVITIAVLAAASVIMLVIPANITQLYAGSSLLRFIGSAFNSYKIPDDGMELHNIKGIKVFGIIFFVLGAAAGVLSPAIICLSVMAAAAVLLILRYTLMGVYMTVFFAPILPTMACASLIILTAISFFIGIICGRIKVYTVTPMSFLITAFIALAAISSLASFNRVKSIEIFILYAAFAFSFFIIVNTLKTKNEWYNLVTVFVLSGLAVALVGIYQNFFGESQSALSWVDSNMFEDIGVRVYGTFDNPNVLGQYLVLLTPVAVAMLVSAKNVFSKIVFFVSAAAMLICIVYTWSRAAWVAVVLAIGFFMIMKDRRWATVCIVMFLIMPFVLPESIMSRITSIGNMKDSSTAYRVSVWIASLRIAKDYWLGGIGLGSGAFERIYQNYALNGAGFALHSHNFYIQLVVEMGILGLVVFAAIIFMAFKQIASLKDKNSVNKNVALAIGGALIGYLFQGVAENLWYNYRMVLIFWIYLAILQSGVILSQKENCIELK